MNKKISLGIAISLMAVVATIAIMLTYTVAINTFEQRMSAITDRQVTNELLTEIDNKVRQQYDGEIEESTLREGLAEGYINGLANEDCVYCTVEEWELESNRRAGYDFGLGMKISKASDGNIQVNRVTAGSPAAKAGVKKGDIITYVNNVSVLSTGYEKAVETLGSESEVTVKVVRSSGSSSYKITKKQYEIISVEYRTIGTIGYININRFNQKTPDQFNTALNKLRQNDVTALIIDLRDSEGGSYEDACAILDTLLPACRLMTFTDNSGVTKDMYKSDKNCLDLPICVMINGNTTGASELFASALFDGGCDLIGTSTQGQLSVREYFELSDGSAICLTTGAWNTATDSARSEGKIVPNFEVELSSYQEEHMYLLKDSEDPQMVTALERAKALVEANTPQTPATSSSDA